jgi:conjugal transfer/type IV secretion protein DotA/TraY
VVILKLKNLFYQLGVLFVGFFFMSEVFAFDVPMSDKSRQYLGMIFGGSVGPIVLSDENNVVIGRLFAQLNSVVFVLGTLMVGYITVVSTLNTAKEGHAMGQKWSSMWVPVRSVLGLLVMVPTPVSGYSAIQVTVMWFVLQGIGAANSVWQVALDAIGSGLSVTAVKGYNGTPDSKTITLSSTQLARLQGILQGSFQAAMCTKFVNRFVEINQSDNLQMTRYNIDNTGGGQVSFYLDTTGASPYNKINIGFQRGNKGVGDADFTKICGSATIQCQNGKNKGDCADSAKINTIYQGLNGIYQSMLNLVDPFFDEIDGLSRPFNYRNSAEEIISKLSGNSGLYEAQISQLKDNILQLSSAINFNIGGLTFENPITGILKSAKELGWIHAGSYYMMLNTVVASVVSDGDYDFIGSGQNPNYGDVKPSVGSDAISYMAYRNIASADINSILAAINSDLTLPVNLTINYDSPIYSMMNLSTSTSAAKIAGSSLSKFFNRLLISDSSLVPHAAKADVGQSAIGGGSVDTSMASSNRVGITATGAIRTFQSWINKSTDPLLGISMFGANLMITAEVMLVIAYAASVALSFTSVLACPVSFKGVSEQLILGVIFPAATAAILLWLAGATFAVYVPMIPYLMFTATAVGWMFAVIEAIVAAPVLALGLVSPSGDELGKAGQGMLILVGLFLKPTLMIFGFILASRLLKAILTMVNNMFAATVDANIAGVSPLFGWVVPMILYAGFVVALTNKCFSLIHILPEKIMRWLGSQGDGFGTEEVMQKTESKTTEGVGAAHGAMKGAGESAQKKGGDKVAARAKAKADAEKGQSD